MMKSKKCILLVRVSTEAQSYEAQERELYELASKDGYSKEQITSIALAESGIGLTEEQRLGLQEMYKYISTGEYDCVYAWEVSRIARTKKVLFSVQNRLVKDKIQLIIKNPSLRLLKDNGEIDEGAEMVFTLFAQLAEAEMRNKKERFARGKRAKAKDGLWVGEKLPFGYSVDYNNNRKIIINEKEKEIIIATYNLYEEGCSQTKIPMELEKKGFERISIALVNHILKNRGYVGEWCDEKKMPAMSGRGEWTKYPRRYPPIISKEQYERCRELAKASNTKLNSKTRNLYYGGNLIYCPSCGSKWVGNAHDTAYHCYISHLSPHVYEYGSYKKLGEQCKNNTHMSINILDSLLWQVALHEETVSRLDDNESEISNIKNDINSKNKDLIKLDELKAKIRKKKDIASLLFIDGKLTQNAYNRKLSELDKEKAECEQEIVSISTIISQLEMKQTRLETRSAKSATFKKLKGVLSDEDYKKFCDTFNLAKSIGEEISELEKSATDTIRYNLIHEHIEKVFIEPVSFRYLHKTKRLGDKLVDGKLIRIYTYNEALKFIKNKEPSQYPYYFVSVSNDGIGGKTIYSYLKYNHEFQEFDKDNIDLYGGDFLLNSNFTKLERFVCERKIEKRKKEKEERKKLHSSIEYLLEKEEEKKKKKEERKRKAREYAKWKYWEDKKRKS